MLKAKKKTNQLVAKRINAHATPINPSRSATLEPNGTRGARLLKSFGPRFFFTLIFSCLKFFFFRTSNLLFSDITLRHIAHLCCRCYSLILWMNRTKHNAATPTIILQALFFDVLNDDFQCCNLLPEIFLNSRIYQILFCNCRF